MTLVLLPLTASAQKAYDVVKYSGSSDALLVELDFADGYPEGSELTVSQGKKKTTMSPESDEMAFQGTLAGKPLKVLLKMDAYGGAPSTIKCSVVLEGRETRLTLKKK